MIDGRFDVVGAAGPTAFFGGLERARLGHGYLFTGPAGSGKRTFALRLAQSLLCERGGDAVLGYDATCGACRRVEAGVHPDVLVGDGQVKIGDRDGGDEASAREVVRRLSMRGYTAGTRVGILADAEFTREAANALLKFFEEPPDGVLLIVTTPVPGRLLVTIRSRLLEVPFARLADADVERILLARGVAADEAARVAPLAAGDADRALALLEGEDSVRDAVVAWFRAAARGEEADASGWAVRATLEDGIATVRALARDWLALRLAGSGAPLLAPDARGMLDDLPAREPADLVRVVASLGDAERTARTNVSPALVADLARIALAPR